MMLLRRLQVVFNSRHFKSCTRSVHSTPDAMIVTVSQGALRGRKTTSKYGGGTFFSYQGIPYAHPPIGRLRFKAPEPPLPWSGVRDALKEGNVCAQIDPMLNEYIGSEDCLFLNVFTPQIPVAGASQAPKMAVMFFIHGGGFATGSGNCDFYGPDHLVNQGVVVVTINYRLGLLGFLSTGDGEIPGNAGMKDQVAALRWVQQNISRFGGDPNNVTIFGESAGGASVHYHLLSPMSKGLFHRAISQSGSALNCWAFSRAVPSRTVRLAKALGCESESSKDILALFRELPAKKLVENQTLALSSEEKRRAGNMRLPFVPTPELMVDSSEEKFLLGEPIDIIKSGNFTMVPYITGVNSNEGLLVFMDVVGKPEVQRTIDNDFERVLPEDMFPRIDTAKSREASQKLKQFFFGNLPLCEETLSNYFDLKSDTLFVHTINKTVELQAQKSSAPIYYYEFAFDGALGLYKNFVLNTDMPGVAHADELGYLFNPSVLPMEIEADSAEMKMIKIMVKMWTNFAKTGNPSVDVIWQPVSPKKTCYLRIDEVCTMEECLKKKRMDFWNYLYQTYQSSQSQTPTSKL